MKALILFAIVFSTLTAQAALHRYTSNFDNKELTLEVSVDNAQSVYPNPSQCKIEWPEMYNDRSGQREPAGSAMIPCAQLKFGNFIQIKATLTDLLSHQSQTEVVSTDLDFKEDKLSNKIKEYFTPTWDIQFSKFGFGVKLGNWAANFPVAVVQGFDGKYSMNVDFNDVLNFGPGREPFWCASYDPLATAVWYKIAPIKGTYSVFRSADVCGSMIFSGK